MPKPKPRPLSKKENFRQKVISIINQTDRDGYIDPDDLFQFAIASAQAVRPDNGMIWTEIKEVIDEEIKEKYA